MTYDLLDRILEYRYTGDVIEYFVYDGGHFSESSHL